MRICYCRVYTQAQSAHKARWKDAPQKVIEFTDNAMGTKELLMRLAQRHAKSERDVLTTSPGEHFVAQRHALAIN